MIKILIPVLFLISIELPVVGQGNDSYINSQIEKINSLINKGEFVNGFIYFENDTIETDLLTFRGKRKKNYFLFCVAKNQIDSIQIYMSNQIKGYKIFDTTYKSHNSEGCGFFLKQLYAGKIDLFERNALPNDNRLLYYLRFSNTDNYFIINPLENNVTIYTLPSSSSGTVAYIHSKGIPDKFKIFIATYLGDCAIVTNMVQSGFYTIDDIPSIIETYNNCFE